MTRGRLAEPHGVAMPASATARRQERIRQQLNSVGLKATPQRLTVLQTMLTHERRHLSAEDVYQRIAQQNGLIFPRRSGQSD